MSALVVMDPAVQATADVRARAAWLLAADMAETAVTGAAFLRIYDTPGKVGRGSDAKTALARKFACYLAVTVANVQPAVLARAARLNRKTVHCHLVDVEDMRDDAGVDRLLDELKDRMVRAACAIVMANLGEAA
jgi:hypothetical protein